MRQGFILGVMLIVISMVLALLVGFSVRVSVDLNQRQAEDVRQQALWLARSALETGQRGTTVVETAYGPATVQVSGDGVEVTLQGAMARMRPGQAASYVPAPQTDTPQTDTPQTDTPQTDTP